MFITHAKALDILRLCYMVDGTIVLIDESTVIIDGTIMKWNPFEGKFLAEEK